MKRSLTFSVKETFFLSLICCCCWYLWKECCHLVWKKLRIFFCWSYLCWCWLFNICLLLPGQDACCVTTRTSPPQRTSTPLAISWRGDLSWPLSPSKPVAFLHGGSLLGLPFWYGVCATCMWCLCVLQRSYRDVFTPSEYDVFVSCSVTTAVSSLLCVCCLHVLQCDDKYNHVRSCRVWCLCVSWCDDEYNHVLSQRVWCLSCSVTAAVSSLFWVCCLCVLQCDDKYNHVRSCRIWCLCLVVWWRV